MARWKNTSEPTFSIVILFAEIRRKQIIAQILRNSLLFFDTLIIICYNRTMKVLTKEWYMDGDRASIIRWINADPRAEKFDEAYYQEVYNRLLNSELSMFDITPQETAPKKKSHLRKLLKKSKDLDKVLSRFFAELEVYAKTRDIDDSEDDRERSTKHFEGSHRQQIQLVESLPDEIKQRIADKRLFALGYATQDVINLLKPYCEALQDAVNSTLCDVHITSMLTEINTTAGKEIWEKNLKLKPQKRLHLNRMFHSEDIIDQHWEGDSLWIGIYDRAIVIRNAKILQEEEPILGTTWLEHETYKTDTGFEFHFLFLKYKRENCFRSISR